MGSQSLQEAPAPAAAEQHEWDRILRGIQALGRQRDRLAARCRRLVAALRVAKYHRRAGLDREARPAPPPAAGGAAPTIPGYTILGVVRDGAMGRVYRARQDGLGRRVAVKVLHAGLAGQPEYVRRFRREAQLAARLAHRHIPRVFDAGEVDGRPYLVMEYVDGETAQDRLDRGEVFGEREAVAIALDVARALRHARRRGLIHRDVKPANLMLSRRGVQLIDWGLARRVDDFAWATAEAGSAIGTPQYISPEQIRGQVDVDIRADIYGLGATLYHMVTGRAPYGGDTTAEALRGHTDSSVRLVPPDAVVPGLSGRLGAVIGKMMARNRQDRYRQPDDLILDLQCLLRGDRPLLADSAPEALAPLAAGEANDGPSPRGDVADRGGIALLVAPALLLALALLITVVLLVAA